METLILRRLFTFILAFVFLLPSDVVVGQIDTVISMPCPVGGILTSELSGQLTPSSNTRKKPIMFNGCTPSSNTYPYQDYWVKVPNQTIVQVKNNSNTDIAIYRASTNVLEFTCGSLLAMIKANQTVEIETSSTEEVWTIVIHAALLNDFPDFSVEFSTEVGVLDFDCAVKYYKTCDEEALSQPKNVPIFNEDFDGLIVVEEDLKRPFQYNYGNLLKSYKLDGQVIAQSEHLVFYGTIDDFPTLDPLDDLEDFTISCLFPGYPNDFSPSLIYKYLKETLGDSIANKYQWPGKYSSLIICDQFYYSYIDQVINEISYGTPKVIKRTFTFKNFISLEVFQKIQNITIVYDQQTVEIQRFDTIHTSVDPWGCVATITLPLPKLTGNCGANYTFLKLIVPSGMNSLLADNQYIVLGIPKGIHQLYFVYDDGVTVSDTSIINVNVYKRFFNSSILKLPTFYVESLPYQISVADFDRYIDDHCSTYELTVEEPNTPCDSINDGIINICCDMLVQNSQFYNVKVTFKEYGLNSSDQIVVIDSFWEQTWIDIRQKINKIQCPTNVTFDCQTLDYSPSIAGNAKAIGVCGEVNILKFKDTVIPINGNGKKINRTFQYPESGTAQMTCTQVITLECTSATDESAVDQNLLVRPNPFDSQIYIDANGIDKNATIQFFDIKGRYIDANIFYNEGDQRFEILTSHWPHNAIYLYKIVTNGHILSGKVMKM